MRSATFLTGAFVLTAGVLLSISAVLFGGGFIFQNNLRFMAYFEGSHRGLSVGSPVLLRGVVIGRVSEIRVEFDANDAALIRIPVMMDLDPRTIIELNVVQQNPEDAIQTLIQRGLRAQLILQSFVINQLAVSLDFHPLSTPRFVGQGPFPELPTIASPFDEIARSLDNFSLADMMEDVRATLKGVRQVIESPELLAMIVETQHFMRDLRQTLPPLTQQVDQLLGELQQFVTETRVVVPQLTHQLDALITETQLTMTTARQNLMTLTPNAQQTLRAYQNLAEGVQRDVQARLRELRPAMTQATQLLAQVAALIDVTQVRIEQLNGPLSASESLLRRTQQLLASDGSVGYGLPTALNALTAMANSLKNLADLLERRPESLLYGRGQR